MVSAILRCLKFLANVASTRVQAGCHFQFRPAASCRVRPFRLTPFFERMIISSEVGADKPDPYIFRYALDALRAEPADAIHVGDDPERDWGAEAIGAAFFSSSNVPTTHFAQSDLEAVGHALLPIT